MYSFEEKEFEEFLEWIRSIYPVKTRQSWANIVLFHSADERDALNKLFELFEEHQLFIPTKTHPQMTIESISK